MKYKGILRTIGANFKFLTHILSHLIPARVLVRLLETKLATAEKFEFNGKELKYFYHSYQNQRLSDRAIEIPIIRYFMEKEKKRDFLEIGNVTNHYYTYFQDIIDSKVVVDKYEIGWGVINKDIYDYQTDIKFDFIFSISTFEHMDSNNGKNPDYIKGKSKLMTYAADNLVHVCHNLLNEGGLFILTAPLKQHHEWDQTLFSGKVFTKEILKVKSIKIYFFKKINEIEWQQTDIVHAKKAKYDSPFVATNALSIIEIRK